MIKFIFLPPTFQRMPMKTLTSLLLITFLTASLALLGGCGKKPVQSYSSQSGTNAPEGKDISTRGTISEENMPGEESLDAGEALGGFSVNSDQKSDEYKRTYGRSSIEMQPVYFDFDQATIRDDQVPRLEHDADYMKNNPGRNLVIEGNSDERGTNEYNLALGERRALNAKNYLIELGVEETRIRTVSYGEERPLFSGQSEDDWAQNRRDDFVLE
ncbi:MAG TPA: peptidoglycan-associated lipoprotein Pal [Desulfobulbaceae bacterium]|nr:peptidoglycan-associated lipoprotein Pal [Desulfobulbaceae bacterium]